MMRIWIHSSATYSQNFGYKSLKAGKKTKLRLKILKVETFMEVLMRIKSHYLTIIPFKMKVEIL